MAIDMTTGATGLPRSAAMKSYVLEREIDFADVLTEKGEALAADDIINVFDIPIKHAVMAATIHPVTAVAPASACTLDLGFTASPEADPDNFVDGFDATQITTDGVPIFAAQGYTTAATTIDLEIATLTGVLSTVNVKIAAWVIDLS